MVFNIRRMCADTLEILDSQRYELDRPMSGTRWTIPQKIELKGERLYWEKDGTYVSATANLP